MYKLIDILNPKTIIGQSNEIATLWKVIDNQHFMLKTSLVIVKGDEIVAGEVSLLDKMVAKQVYKLDDVAKIF